MTSGVAGSVSDEGFLFSTISYYATRIAYIITASPEPLASKILDSNEFYRFGLLGIAAQPRIMTYG
jgi:hypothetical protein